MSRMRQNSWRPSTNHNRFKIIWFKLDDLKRGKYVSTMALEVALSRAGILSIKDLISRRRLRKRITKPWAGHIAQESGWKAKVVFQIDAKKPLSDKLALKSRYLVGWKRHQDSINLWTLHMVAKQKLFLARWRIKTKNQTINENFSILSGLEKIGWIGYRL